MTGARRLCAHEEARRQERIYKYEPGELLPIVMKSNNTPVRKSRRKNVIICEFFYQRICGESAAT